MTPTSPVPARYTDTRRNSDRYEVLVAELSSASEALRLEGRERETVEETLTRLLPHLCDALNGGGAFLAEVTASDQTAGPAVVVAAVHPERAGAVHQILPWSPLFQKLQGTTHAVVKDNRKDPSRPIPGLELFAATSAVVVRLQMGPRSFLIGVFNRKDERLGFFLASDRTILLSLIELLSVGIELGERRKQELESILKAGLDIKVERGQDEQLQIIAESAQRAFSAPVSVMLWDENHTAMIIRAVAGLPAWYCAGQSVPRDKVEALFAAMRGKRSMANLQLQRSPYGDRKLVHEAGLTGVLFTSLVVDGTLEGVLNIYSRQAKPHFGQREYELAGIFASQAEQVIHNARMYEQLANKNKHIEAVNSASKLIISDVGKGRAELMLGVLREAVETITGAAGERATVGVLLLEREGALVFESIYPPGLESTLNMPADDRLPLDPLPGKLRSISVRAFRNGRPENVPDVSKDPDYHPFCADTRSELAVPLFEKSLSGDMRPVGVLNVESSTKNAFDRDDEGAMQALADLAVIALRTVEQGERLARANTVAYMGAWAASLAHDFHHDVGRLRLKIDLLRTDPNLPGGCQQQVDLIEHLANGLSMPALPENDYHIQARGHQTRIPLDRLLENLLIPLRDAFPHAQIDLDGGCQDEVVVMDDETIKLVLRHLVRNSAESFAEVAGQRSLRIFVKTEPAGDFVRVRIHDNGPGVPPEKAKLLFHTLMPLSPQGGRGLPLVQFLVEHLGGTIQLCSNRPGEGACFAFTLKTLQAALKNGMD